MTVAEERAEALAREVSGWPIEPEQRRAILKKLETRWRSNGAVVSLVFFVLTLAGVTALYFFCDLIEFPKGWVTAALSIGLAEVLIRRYRFFGTGVESALWVGGLFAWIFAIPSEGRPEGLLLFAAACAIAGARVRNPLIGAGAAIFAISYLGAKDWCVAALLAGIIVAAIALVELLRVWQRPSAEALFTVLLIVCPIVGAACSTDRTSLLWSLAYIALALAAFTIGVRARHRGALYGGALYGGAVSTVIAAVVLRDLFHFAVEWKCIAAGALLFAISAAIVRSLRGKREGFVMTPTRSLFEETLVIAGTVGLAPQMKANAAAKPIGGGGDFGGAGATGSF